MEACQGSDVLLLGGAGNVAGTTIAEKLDIPFVAAFLQPLSTPTREYAAAFFPRLPIEVGPVNRLSYRLAVQGFWQFFRRAINEARQSYFDMPPLPFLGPFGRYASEKRPILYGYSRHLVPRPADWPDHAWVTGNWFLERSRGWKPDRDLLAFMEAGPPPVYIGFGSMNSRDPQRTTRLVHDALAETGQRGILLSGWGGMISESRPKHIFVAEDIPHDWLFPRVSAVVHHGGAGTTAAGLRAGAPTVTIPFFGDQPFWGWRVYKLGAGPKPLPQKRLTKEKLACAIDRAVNDASMRTNALALREKLVAEDGVGNAVARFQALFPS
jgi:UDP:flavonoid glycosyltransferase YjiC (YdhE family)